MFCFTETVDGNGPFTTRNFVASVVGDAAEVIEKFTKYIDMIVTTIGLEFIEGHYEIESVHQWPPIVETPAGGSKFTQCEPGKRARGKRP
ncbi:MAG: hypothetical protein WA478_15395 [Pseudolabrys sp.]